MRGLKIESGEIAGVRFDEGKEEKADAYVFAVPHTALAELLPESVKQSDPSLGKLGQNQSRANYRRAFLVRPPSDERTVRNFAGNDDAMDF